jgi:hypothetical protein
LSGKQKKVADAEKAFHWFPFRYKEWFANRSVRLMKDFQKGWYISLLIECWMSEGTLPNDPEILWQLAGADSREKFEAHSQLVLNEFEPATLDEKSVLVHVEMASLYAEQVKKYDQRVEAARISVERRKARTEGGVPPVPMSSTEAVH